MQQIESRLQLLPKSAELLLFASLLVCLTGCITAGTRKDELSQVSAVIEATVRDSDGAPGRAVLSRATGNAQRSQALAHRWVPLAALDRHPITREAAYFTYLISGEVGGPTYSGTNEQLLAGRKNLRAALREIKASQPAPQASAPTQVRVLRLTPFNAFVIPQLAKPPADGDELQAFDFAASRNLREVSLMLLPVDHVIRRALQREGPFLLATKQPLHELAGITSTQVLPERDPDLLFLDLTDVAAASIPVFLNVFRDSLQDEGVQGKRELRSLRARLVSALLKLDDAIPFIATASATLARPAQVDKAHK